MPSIKGKNFLHKDKGFVKWGCGSGEWGTGIGRRSGEEVIVAFKLRELQEPQGNQVA